MYIQLLEHLNENNISAEEQIGFRTKSTVDKATFNVHTPPYCLGHLIVFSHFIILGN
jgi:hypothetical protein